MIFNRNHHRHFYPYEELPRQQVDPYLHNRERLPHVTSIFPALPPRSYVAGNPSSVGNPYELRYGNEEEPGFNPNLPYSKRPDARFERLREKVRTRAKADEEEKQREVAEKKGSVTYAGRDWTEKERTRGERSCKQGGSGRRRGRRRGKRKKT